VVNAVADALASAGRAKEAASQRKTHTPDKVWAMLNG
jgi:hypothetical protein